MSWEKYSGYHFATKTGVNAESHTGTHNGPAVDRQTYDHMVATLVVGTMVGTAVDATVQDSADGSTGWADYAPNVLFGNNKSTGTAAAFVQQTTMGSTKLDVDLSGAKRYIRFNTSTTGGAVTYSISCLLGQRSGTIAGSTA